MKHITGMFPKYVWVGDGRRDEIPDSIVAINGLPIIDTSSNTRTGTAKNSRCFAILDSLRCIDWAVLLLISVGYFCQIPQHCVLSDLR